MTLQEAKQYEGKNVLYRIVDHRDSNGNPSRWGRSTIHEGRIVAIRGEIISISASTCPSIPDHYEVDDVEVIQEVTPLIVEPKNESTNSDDQLIQG